ncbi:MAG: transglutaminase domain-containing protein [Alistipes sp.]
MKNFLLFCVGCFVLVQVQAQEVDFSSIDKVFDELVKEVASKDYARAADCCDQLDALVAALPDSLRSNFGSGISYNGACFRARAGRYDAALSSFERYANQVIGTEEINFIWIQKDADLDSLRTMPRFVKTLERLRVWGDYRAILRDATPYKVDATDSLPVFWYADASNPCLVRVRERFKLDSIAGGGDELSKIRNLLTWVHNTVPHDGSSYNPSARNALAMVELCRRENRGVNCRMLAQILNECYLSMGFKSRFVTCMPKNYMGECHVINVVYSTTLGKWLWVDPTFNAYVTDPNGEMLSIAEVRERMRDGRTVKLNAEANWNGTPKNQAEYLDHYMAKNLYWFTCSNISKFSTETAFTKRVSPLSYVALIPEGYADYKWQCSRATTDDAWFWQAPTR